MKTLAFQYLSLIENDINSQKKGTVVLLYFLGNIPLDWDNDFQQNHAPQILEWLPIKVKSIHFCCDSKIVNMLVPLLATPLHRRNRVRLRVHAGSRTECHYSLMTFGFPVQIIPVTSGNKLKTATHLKCAAKQQSRDMAIRQFGAFEGIDLPGSYDILLGRGMLETARASNDYLMLCFAEAFLFSNRYTTGKNLQEHSGNQIMRKLSKSRWTSTWTQIRSPKQGSRGIC